MRSKKRDKTDYKKPIALIFCLVLLLNFSNLKAQHQYIPIPENAEWVYGMIDGNCAPPLNLCGYTHFKISGDTIIGDYTYKKFMGTGLKDNNYIYLAAIRQDIQARKVYVLKSDYFGGCSNVDTLLYDFSAGQGDTLKQCDNIIGGTLNPTIESVDSILVAGLWRKKIILNLMNGPSLIEGIGSSNGFLGQWGGWIGGYNFLVCFSINGVPVYPDSICTFVGLNSEAFSKPEIRISPNPAKDYLYVYLNSDKQTNIKYLLTLYDITGRVLYQKELINSLTFDCSSYSRGLVFYNISTTANQQGISGKIILQ